MIEKLNELSTGELVNLREKLRNETKESLKEAYKEKPDDRIDIIITRNRITTFEDYDLPLKIHYGEKHYRIDTTRSGSLHMTKWDVQV